VKTIRRLLYRDIVSSVAFVAIAFLSLFYFIDLVDQLDGVGSRGRTVLTVATTALYELPGHAYELMPIAVLIGTIYSLSRMAQGSEFTILRTGGLGPRRALLLLAVLGVAFAALTFVIGDIVAPASERQAVLLQARLSGGLRLAGAGAWLKEKRPAADGEHSVSVNVGGLEADGALRDVRVFDFDPDGRLAVRLQAPRARVDPAGGHWTLENATELRWPATVVAAPADAPPAAVASAPAAVASSSAASSPAATPAEPAIVERRHASLDWTTGLDGRVVAAALLPAETMTTVALWRYAGHLSSQEQTAQRPQLLFWKRAFYPFACIVMVALALPFAYLHARAGGVSLKVFGGIMLGISFVLLNNIAGHIGVLSDLTPWMVSAAPSLLYLLLSLAAFAWLVRYR
jgi:lipopolysaccharide export system permease protein